MDYRKTAKKLKDIGISVIPLRKDGSKLPKIEWKVYQERLMTDYEINKYFEECGGVAALTGKFSRLYNLDFDLKYELDTQDFWTKFMDRVPKEMKKRMMVNTTRNKGMHVWLRTDFAAKSTHLTKRASTIPELMDKYTQILSSTTKTPEQASELILRKPYEVVIETRSRGSYAVIAHPDYNRVFGTLNEFSVEEVEFLNEIAYSLDYCYQPKPVFKGKVGEYSSIRKYNDNANGALTLSLLESSGMFKYIETERNGNIKVLRLGSTSGYSGRIYADSGVFHVFTSNSLFDTAIKSSYSPFEVYTTTKNLTFEQAMKELSKT